MLTVRKAWFGFMAFCLALSLSACAGGGALDPTTDGSTSGPIMEKVPEPATTYVLIDGDCG